MVRLLVPVNYKGSIYEPGIAYFDSDYENLLVSNGNATFDLKEPKANEQEDMSLEDAKANNQEDMSLEDDKDKVNESVKEENEEVTQKSEAEKPKTTKSTRKSTSKE